MQTVYGVPALNLAERIVTFESDGVRLPGIVTSPTATGPDKLGLLLLSPGLKHRVGPHRLHLKLARFAATRGLHVFRFDFHGTGDAEGELPGREVPDLHERIQNGFFKGDAVNALRAFKEETGVERVIACGLCGGAITALYLADADSMVDGIIGFQLPVKVLDQESDFADQISEEYSDFILMLYLKKLFNPDAWRNFFTGKSEYGLIRKTITRRLGRLFGAGGREGGERSIPEGINRIFLQAYDNVAGRVKMLWIYSEQERARYDFESEFEKCCLAGSERPYTKRIIEGSNHEMAPDDAQEHLFALIDDWLEHEYGTRPGGAE
ncbi:MAG: hypothetical protein GY835_04495 [bacterium]|nr:hypothetical protein [bacterium]